MESLPPPNGYALGFKTRILVRTQLSAEPRKLDPDGWHNTLPSDAF